MSPFESIKTCLFIKYLNTHDRACRSEFWWFAGPSLIIHVLINHMLAAEVSKYKAILWYHPILLVVALILIIPLISVGVRRIHDQNAVTSMGYFGVLSWVGLVYSTSFLTTLKILGPQQLYFIMTDFSSLLSIFLLVTICMIGPIFLFLTFKAGTFGDNQYGPNPLGKQKNTVMSGSHLPHQPAGLPNGAPNQEPISHPNQMQSNQPPTPYIQFSQLNQSLNAAIGTQSKLQPQDELNPQAAMSPQNAGNVGNAKNVEVAAVNVAVNVTSVTSTANQDTTANLSTSQLQALANHPNNIPTVELSAVELKQKGFVELNLNPNSNKVEPKSK